MSSYAFTRETLRKVLLQTRAGSFFRGPDADAKLDQFAISLREFVEAHRRRFPKTPDPGPLELFETDPVRGRAFFEVDTLELSPEMKLAVWCILMGFSVHSLEMQFQKNAPFSLRIQLQGSEDRLELFESRSPGDFRLIRHLLTMQINDRVEFQGYYAFAS
jgi:hypothetical protein